MPKPTKMPRALAVRGILIDHVKADMDTHYVCAPMPSLKSAHQRAKFENLSEEQKVQRMAEAINGPYLEWKSRKKGELYGDTARAALAVMEGRTL